MGWGLEWRYRVLGDEHPRSRTVRGAGVRAVTEPWTREVEQGVRVVEPARGLTGWNPGLV